MERSATVSALSSARSATLQRTHTHSSLSAARSMANLHKSRYAISTKNKLAPRQVLKDHRNEETFIAAGSGNMLRSTNLDSVDSNSWQAVSSLNKHYFVESLNFRVKFSDIEFFNNDSITKIKLLCLWGYALLVRQLVMNGSLLNGLKKLLVRLSKFFSTEKDLINFCRNQTLFADTFFTGGPCRGHQ